MSIKEKNLRHRVLALTGTFETSALPPECFAGVSGNFDGAGMSFGFIQFNMKSGTLQPILRKMFKNHDGLMREIFGSNYQALKNISQPIATSKQIAFGNSISVPTNKRLIVQPWRDQFKALGRTDQCIEYQLEASKIYMDNALSMFNKFGLFSERGFALCFDICVQGGSMDPKGYNVTEQVFKAFGEISSSLCGECLEVEKMKIMAQKRSAVCKLDKGAADPEWIRKDFLLRKMCIALGKGSVHGLKIDLLDQFNLTLNPAKF